MIKLRVFAHVTQILPTYHEVREVDFGIIAAPDFDGSDERWSDQLLRNWASNYLAWCEDHRLNGIKPIFGNAPTIVSLSRIEIVSAPLPLFRELSDAPVSHLDRG